MSLNTRPVPLNATNLLSTPYRKPPGDRAVEEFVKQQSQFAKQYIKDGASDFESWGVKEPIFSDSPLPLGSKATAAARAITSFSPLLQARVPESHIGIAGTGKNVPHDIPGISSKAANPPHNAHAQALSNSGDLDEHEARLAERRERRRAKKAILDPPLPALRVPSLSPSIAITPEPSPKKIHRSKHSKKQRSHEAPPPSPPKNAHSGDSHGRSSDASPPQVKKKKVKLAPGLALMQNFIPTNVARSRITLKPAPKIGVFNKGVASARTKVDHQKSKHRPKNNKGRGSKGKSAVQTVFTEAVFLDRTRPRKTSPATSQSSPSGSHSHRSRDRPVRPKKSQRKTSKSRSPSASSPEPVHTLKLRPQTLSRFFPRAISPPSAKHPQENAMPRLDKELHAPQGSRPVDGEEGPLSPPWEIDWEGEGLSSPNIDVPHIRKYIKPIRKSFEAPSLLLREPISSVQDKPFEQVQEYDFQVPIPPSFGNTEDVSCPPTYYTAPYSANTQSGLLANSASAHDRTYLSPRLPSNTLYHYPNRSHDLGASGVHFMPASTAIFPEPPYNSMTASPSHYFLPSLSTSQPQSLPDHTLYKPGANICDPIPVPYVDQQQYTQSNVDPFDDRFFEEEPPCISFGDNAPHAPVSPYGLTQQDVYDTDALSTSPAYLFSATQPHHDTQRYESNFDLEPALYNEDDPVSWPGAFTTHSPQHHGAPSVDLDESRLQQQLRPPSPYYEPFQENYDVPLEEFYPRPSQVGGFMLDDGRQLHLGPSDKPPRDCRSPPHSNSALDEDDTVSAGLLKAQQFQQGRALLLGVESFSGHKDVEMELAKSLVGSGYWGRGR